MMASQVPYSPVPSVGPSGQAVPELRVNASSDAFGVNIGEAIKGLGGTVQHVGDELFQRGLALQKLQNETIAKQADTDYMIKAGDLHAKFSALEGQDAVNAFPEYAKNLQKSREEIRASLGNDEARRFYDSQSLSTMGRSIFNGAGHSATEQKKWTHRTLDAQDSAVIKSVDDDPTSDTNVSSALRTLEQNSYTRQHLMGASKEQRVDDLSKRKSILVSQRIMSIAKKDPEAASAMLDTFSKELYGDDKRKVENYVQTSLETRGAAIVSANVMDRVRKAEDSGKPMTMREAVDIAEEQAKKARPDDAVYQQAVRRSTESAFNVFKRIRAEDYQQNRMTLESGLLGLSDPNGRIPTSIAELQADPKSAQALDWAKQNRPDLYRSVQTGLAKNSKGDVIETPERRDRYHTLLGMSQTNPAEFLDVKLSDEDIPRNRQTELYKLQLKVQGKAGDDPRVGAAMRQLEPALRGAGITMQTKDDYLKFKGSLMGAMEAYRDEKKTNHVPTDEIQKMGARLLQEKSNPSGWFPWSKERAYAIPVPEPAAKAIKEDPAWNGVVPTDEQVMQIYARAQFKKLYGKSATTPQVPTSK